MSEAERRKALDEARKRAAEAQEEVSRLEAIERAHPRHALAKAAELYVRLVHDMGTCHDPLRDLERAAVEYVRASRFLDGRHE